MTAKDIIRLLSNAPQEASAWKISIHRAVSDATGFVLTFENQHRSDDDYLVKAQKELNSIEFTDLHNLSSHGE